MSLTIWLVFTFSNDKKQANPIITIQKLKFKAKENVYMTHDKANEYGYDYYNTMKFGYNK